MKALINKINEQNIKENETLHRYRERFNQDLATIYELKYCLKSNELYEEISSIHQYICSIILPLLPTYPDIDEYWSRYLDVYEKTINDCVYNISELNNAFQELANKWSKLQDDNNTSLFAKKKLDIYLFYKDLSEESVVLLTGAPFTGKTHTLTHYNRTYARDTSIIFYANHFSSQNIQEELLQVLNTYDRFDDFLLQLNNYGKNTNRCINIIIDGINEAPEFDIIKFKEEFEQLKALVKDFPYIKILISIRQEYISFSDGLSNHIIEISKPKYSDIQNICSNLKIPKQVINASMDEPIGFYYLVADVFQNIPPRDREQIKNFTKSKIFEKRWEQIEVSCNKQYDFDITPLMLRNKLLEYIADNNVLTVPLSIFTDDEITLLEHFQKERLVTVGVERVEFQHQYYCDYYTISWLEKNWQKKQKNIARKAVGFVVDVLWRCVNPVTPFDYEVDIIKEGVDSTYKIAKNIVLYKFKDFLLACKYHNIIKSTKLSPIQHIILLEHLREYDFEMPIEELADNKNRYLWLESLRHLSIDEIENNEKIQERISYILDDKKIDSLYMIWNKIPKKAHKILLNLSLKMRDYFFSNILSNSHAVNELHEEVDSKTTQEWYNLFASFTSLHKQNELYRLVWLLALPDRELRDKSTRILINVLYNDIELFNALWSEMNNVNDPYIVERLFIIGYSILLNGEQQEKQILLAKELYQFAYFNGKAYPHIIIQEYGLRIYTWLLSRGIWQEPYHLQIEKTSLDFIKPIESNGIKLEEYIGSNCKSSMMLECEGRYGDFGRYIFQSAIEHLKQDSLNIELDTLDMTNFNNFVLDLSNKFPNLTSMFNNIAITQLQAQKVSVWSGVGASNSFINGLPDEYIIQDPYRYTLNIPVPLSKEVYYMLIQDNLLLSKYPTSFLFLGKHHIVQRIIFDYWTELDLEKEEFEQFDLYNNAYHSDRYDHRKERFTKKMQWIGMNEYMGHLRNYLGFVPYLARLESYLYFYDFSDEIQEKLLEYLSVNGIDGKLFFNEYDSDCQYFYLNNDISLYLDNSEATVQKPIFHHDDSNILEEIYNVNNQKEIHALCLELSKTNDTSSTEKDKLYILNKLYIDNQWILLYGVEATYSSHVMTLGVRALIYNNKDQLRYIADFRLPYMKGDGNEEFLKITRNHNNQHEESFLYDFQEKSQYDFSGGYLGGETFSSKLITRYSLIKQQDGYEYKYQLVIKKINGLWYINKGFLNIVMNDYLIQGENITWYIFFEKMLPIDASGNRYNKWKGYLMLDNNTLSGQLKSNSKDNDFMISINL